MNSKVTIIIPTHNRHNYLPRSVGWFLRGGYRVVVADSSEAKWQHPLKTNKEKLTYLHIPGTFAVYHQKMALASNAVTTPLVALCADDDFILYSGLERCAEFLVSNSDYSFCQGYSYLFQRFASHNAIWPMLYDFHDVEFEGWVDRFLATKSTAYYGVNRTEVLSESFRFLESCEILHLSSTAGLVDFALTSIVSKHGKMKRLQVPFGLREYSLAVSAVGTRSRLILDQRLPEFFRMLLAHLKQGKDVSVDQEAAILRAFAADWAGQLQYDLIGTLGYREYVKFLPGNLQSLAEYFMREISAVRNFLRRGYLPALKIFHSEDYRLFNNVLRSAGEGTG
jgi:glycosyltransferase domain-containing protein